MKPVVQITKENMESKKTREVIRRNKMSKLEKFRKIMALPEVIQNVELTEQLKDIFVAYFELLEKNNECKT